MRDKQELLYIFNDIYKAIDLFLKQKNFIKELNKETDSNRAIDDLNSLINGEKSLADLFSAFLSNNPKNGFKMMPSYLSLGIESRSIDLAPIETLLGHKDAWSIFNNNKKFFIKEIYPLMYEDDIFQGFIDSGLAITAIDSGESSHIFIEIKIHDNIPILAKIDGASNSSLINVYVDKTGYSPSTVDRDRADQEEQLKRILNEEDIYAVSA